MTHLSYRPYQAGDESGIIELYRTVFDFEMTPALWRWFYVEVPMGPATRVVGVDERNRIVAHYALQPRQFWRRGSACTAGIAMGHMIHPAARDVSVVLELASIAYEACRRSGMAFLYAFPNAMGMPVHELLLDWTRMPEQVEWDGALSVLPSSKSTSTSIAVWDRWPDHDLELASSLTAPAAAIAGRRTAEWIRWRFFDRPEHDPGQRYRLHVAGEIGTVEAYAALKRYDRDGIVYGHILDWQAPDPNLAEQLFTSLSSSLIDWGAERFSCWAPGASTLQPLLVRTGVSETGQRSNFCLLDLRPSDDAPAAGTDDWCITMADSDIY